MDQEKVWLVRSSGKILGPYGFDEVAELIGSHQVSILDEIRDPASRWNFVREHKKFAKLVNEIRTKEAESLDQDTETGSRTTTVKDYNIDQDLTPLPAIPSSQSQILSSAKTPAPSYQLLGHRPNHSLSKWLLAIFSIFLVILAGLYFTDLRVDSEKKSFSSDDLIKVAKVNKAIGAYDKSLEFYRKAQEMGPLDVYARLQMATLLIEVSKQTLEARRLAEDVLAKISGSEAVRAEAQLIQALSFIKENNLLQAEQVYKSILFSDAKQTEARANLGLIHLMRSEFEGASREFMTLQKDGYSEPIVILASAFVALGINENKSDPDGLKMALEDLDRLVKRSTEYRLETQLMRAVIMQKLDESGRAEKTIEDLLEDDPALSRNHIHNLLIDRQIVRWERLSMYCDFLTSKLKEGAISRGLSSYCSFQKEEVAPAFAKIEEARTQYPMASVLTGLNAYYLFSTKRFLEAEQLSKSVLESSSLAVRTYAETCLAQKDWACAERAWGQIMASQPGDIGALFAMGLIQYSKHSPERAMDFIKTGLVKAPNYKPLLDLKVKLDAP